MYCMDNLTIRIPNELKKRLQEFCKRQNRPVGEVVTRWRESQAFKDFAEARKQVLLYE